MAEKTAEIAAVLGAEIWLVGYNDLKPKGLFSLYRDELKECCTKLGILEVDDPPKIAGRYTCTLL